MVTQAQYEELAKKAHYKEDLQKKVDDYNAENGTNFYNHFHLIDGLYPALSLSQIGEILSLTKQIIGVDLRKMNREIKPKGGYNNSILTPFQAAYILIMKSKSNKELSVLFNANMYNVIARVRNRKTWMHHPMLKRVREKIKESC